MRGGGDGDDGRWVHTRWLQSCLESDPDTVGEISNGQIACAHGHADPRHVATGEMKLVSAKAWRTLQQRFRGGPELRDYGVGAQILLDLGVRDMVLLSNTERTIVGLEGYGLSVVGRQPIPPAI